MSQLKAASLTSALLVPKGRATPAALIDQALGEARATRGDTQSPEHTARWVPAAERVRDSAPAGTNGAVVLSLPSAIGDDDRQGHEQAQRKKLSLRLEPMRHFRLKLVSYHLGISAQELLTRALDRYIDLVAPELAQTMPLAGVGASLADLDPESSTKGD